MLLGTWVALTMHFVVMEHSMRHIQALLDGREVRFCRLLIISTLAMILIYILLICNVELRDPVNDPVWAETIVRECGADALLSAFDNRRLIDVGRVAGIFGVYYGTLLQSKCLPGFTKYGVPKASDKCKKCCALGRLVVAIVLCLPFLAMTFFVHSNSFGLIAFMLLDRLIPSLGAGFAVFGLTDIVCVKVIKFYSMEDRNEVQN